jgi:hypothetical protein
MRGVLSRGEGEPTGWNGDNHTPLQERMHVKKWAGNKNENAAEVDRLYILSDQVGDDADLRLDAFPTTRREARRATAATTGMTLMTDLQSEQG